LAWNGVLSRHFSPFGSSSTAQNWSIVVGAGSPAQRCTFASLQTLRFPNVGSTVSG
jgi:hypothetical protein